MSGILEGEPGEAGGGLVGVGLRFSWWQAIVECKWGGIDGRWSAVREFGDVWLGSGGEKWGEVVKCVLLIFFFVCEF